MSWSIEFINWDESNTGTAVYTISGDIFGLKIDPESISGIDYYSQESRIASVSFFNDNSTFIVMNLITNMAPYISPGINNHNKQNFWEYAVRIKKGGTIVYTGWVKQTGFKYDKKTEIITLRLEDALSVMLANNRIRTLYTHEYLFSSFLQSNISKSFASMDDFNLNYVENYDYQTGIEQEGVEIDINNIGDEYYDPNPNHSWWEYFENFWGLPNTWTSNNWIDIDNPFNIKNLRVNDEGIVVLTLMRTYRIYRVYALGGYTIQSTIRYRTVKFDSNHIAYDFYETSATYSYYYNTEIEVLTAFYVDPPTIPGNYVFLGHPTETVAMLDLSDTERYYLSVYHVNPITVNYDGIMNFLTVNITAGEYNVNNLVKMLLMINNLAIKFDNHGNIEIINKDYTIENIEIDNATVFEYKQSSVLRSEVDYTSLLAPMTETNVEPIANALRDFYKEYIPQYEYNLEIADVYNVTLNSEIVVYGKTMVIVEIQKDLDDFFYTIKAWSTGE